MVCFYMLSTFHWGIWHIQQSTQIKSEQFDDWSHQSLTSPSPRSGNKILPALQKLHPGPGHSLPSPSTQKEPPCWLLTPEICFTRFWMYIKGTMQYLFLWAWSLSLNIMFVRLIHVALVLHSFKLIDSISSYELPQCIYPSYSWWTIWLFLIWRHYKQCCYTLCVFWCIRAWISVRAISRS